MRLLLIHTCAAEGLVALTEDARVVATETLPGRGSSEHLVGAIRRLLDARGWRVQQLAAVAVVDGPGSFTGVRVGLSAAKGLCEAGGVGLIAISRLQLVAGLLPDHPGEVVALLDAGRGEFFCGIYRDGLRIREELLTAPQVQQVIHSRRAVACEPQVARFGLGGVDLLPEPGAAQMLAHTLRRIQAGQWSDVAGADANYLRRTDAERLAEGR
jgi:tRNA threonylcarbamoyladenosine biosynthesis protein TsaB